MVQPTTGQLMFSQACACPQGEGVGIPCSRSLPAGGCIRADGGSISVGNCTRGYV